MTGTAEKVRALFLAALMVFSVFGATVAFTGAAAATAANMSETSTGPYQPGDTVQFSTDVDDQSTDVQIWIDTGDGTYQSG